MRVLFLPKYDQKAASFRYRFQQYFPILEAAGIDYTVAPLFDDAYLTQKFERGRAAANGIFMAFLRRLKVMLSVKQYDLVVIHYEILPYVPPVLEWYLKRRGIRYVFDYDDAIFHHYDQHKNPLVRLLLGNKIKSVARNACFVMAGCEYLKQHAEPANPRVKVIPTVIDIERYSRVRSPATPDSQPFRVGWIGSPSTTEYLRVAYPALKEFSRRNDLVLTLVGARRIALEGVCVEYVDWDEAVEIEEMLKWDVGIMPLPDTPWTRGKCGFKLIQYMACGLPVIASPVGVNVEIVDPGGNGFLCQSDREWLEALTQLQENPALRARMGAAGRNRVETRYCKQVFADEVLEIFETAARRSG